MPKLGSNPLDSLEKEKTQNHSDLIGKPQSLEPASLKIINEERKGIDLTQCIYFKTNRDACFCYNRIARHHGVLGKKEEAMEKCGKCHVKKLRTV